MRMCQTKPLPTDSGSLPPLLLTPQAAGGAGGVGDGGATALAEAESHLRPGQTLKHFRILRHIGAGGMGEVYQAEDLKLGRHVAIKLLPAEATRDEKARSRFRREARLASALNHPNIVTIHSIEDDGGMHFIVMEYVEGETLSAAIRRGGALAPPRLLNIGQQVADALAAAHAVGIIHRDIKSENILLTSSGQAKVLDFGIAKNVPAAAAVDHEAATMFDLTGAGVVIGTVHYMSPEQTRGEPLDARTDVFSLGCVLYEAATGTLPFRGPSFLSVFHEIAVAHPAPPSRLVNDLPHAFDLLVERALAKERTGRYASAAELAAALKDLRGTTAAAESYADSSAQAPAATPDAEPEAFVGREAELAHLDELLRRTTEGCGRVVFITGEPGIGKSALLEAFLRRARNALPKLVFSRGRCVEQYGPGEAYLPFLDAVGASSRVGRGAAAARGRLPPCCARTRRRGVCSFPPPSLRG